MKFYNREFMKANTDKPDHELWPRAKVLSGQDWPLHMAIIADKYITEVYVTDEEPETGVEYNLRHFKTVYDKCPFDVPVIGEDTIGQYWRIMSDIKAR